MSIAETIRQRMGNMSEHDQLKMLEHANHIVFYGKTFPTKIQRNMTDY